MANPLYTWVFADPFHSIFIGVTSTVSLFSNSLLLFIIYTTAAEHIGSYRYLLAFFAFCDITTTVGHAALQPYVHMTESVPCDTFFCLIFIATYYQTFLVLAFHFVYRYRTVTSGLGTSCTDFWSKSYWIMIGIIIYVIYISGFVITVAVGMTPSDQTRMDPLTNIMYWSSESIISILICLCLFASTAGVIVYCIYQTTVAIKSSDTLITPKTRRMHRHLFNALLIQTAVPCLFSYAPLSLILLFGGVTGISLGAFGNALFLTTAIFPSVDAFFVLYFIVKFRIAVIRLFRLPFKTTAMGSSDRLSEMSSHRYVWAYTDPLHSIFIGSTTIVSLFSNCLLLFIIYTTAAEHIGSYRYLLAFFAICDIATTVGHAALQPYLHMTSSGFYFFPRYGGNVIKGVPVDTVFCLMFIATFYQTFLVLAFHFVYRYKTVTKGIGTSWTNFWSATHWIVSGVAVYVLYISAYVMTVAIGMTPTEVTRGAVPSEMLDAYGFDLKDPRRGFTVLAVRRLNNATNELYWSSESLISLALCVGLFGTTALVIVYCIYQTNAAIKSADTQITPTTRKMHRQLFRALLIQTAVPCLFSYAPLSVILLFGAVTGVSLGTFGNVLLLTTAIFPSVDAFFVLYFIVKFRIAVVRLFRLPCTNAGKGSSVDPKETKEMRETNAN